MCVQGILCMKFISFKAAYNFECYENQMGNTLQPETIGWPRQDRTTLGVRDYIKRIKIHRETLQHVIEPRFGLLNSLAVKGVVNQMELDDIRCLKSVPRRCEKLLNVLERKTDIRHFEQFLKALDENRQSHVSNFIRFNGDISSIEERPLDENESKQILSVSNNFTEIVDLENTDILMRLEACDAISWQQREYIKCNNKVEKPEMLLDVMSRRSISAWTKFIACLCDTGQSHVAQLFGALVEVHVHVDHPEEEVELVPRLVEMVHRRGRALSDEELAQFIEANIELRRNNLQQMVDVRTGSIVIVFFCKNQQAVQNVKKIVSNGRLKCVLTKLFDSILISNKKTVTILDLHVSEEAVKLAEDTARNNMITKSCKSS